MKLTVAQVGIAQLL